MTFAESLLFRTVNIKKRVLFPLPYKVSSTNAGRVGQIVSYHPRQYAVSVKFADGSEEIFPVSALEVT